MSSAAVAADVSAAAFEDASGEVRWSLSAKVAFRFSFVYLMLYVFVMEM